MDFSKKFHRNWLPSLKIAHRHMPTGSSNIIFWIMSGLFAFFILWASVFHIDEFVHATGEVETSSEEKVITHFEGGVVEEILITEGQHVKAGQVLLRLKDDPLKASRDENTDKYYTNLGHIARLKNQIGGHQAFTLSKEIVAYSPIVAKDINDAFRSYLDSFQKQQEIIYKQKLAKELELKELEGRKKDLEETVRLAEKEVSLLKPLAQKKYVSLTQLIRSQKDLADKNTEYNMAINNIPRVEAQIQELQSRFDQVKNDFNQKDIDELKQREADLGTAHSRMVSDEDRLERSRIVSPTEGIIKIIHVKTLGSSIAPGKEVVTLVPIEDSLYITANVNPKDIGFVREGNQANIKVTAFDYSIFGSLKGKVIHISPDTFFDEKKQPYFKVKLTTSKNYFEHGKSKLFISPGMTTQMSILIGKRTVMNYILKPIIKTLSDSMGEM
jgi:adhesin transport system membrane fusion protein